MYTAVVFHVSQRAHDSTGLSTQSQQSEKAPECPCCSRRFVEQDPTEIYKLYTLRFQTEFLFRPGQAVYRASRLPSSRLPQGASFISMPALRPDGLAKVEAIEQHSGNCEFIFSMASVKRRALNDHRLFCFISNLDLSPSLIKSHPNYEKLRNYGMIAA